MTGRRKGARGLAKKNKPKFQPTPAFLNDSYGRWKVVPEFEYATNPYFVCEDGFIKNKHNRILSKKGGKFIYDGDSSRKVAELVAQAFIGDMPKKHKIAFHDYNKENHQVSNLYWWPQRKVLPNGNLEPLQILSYSELCSIQKTQKIPPELSIELLQQSIKHYAISSPDENGLSGFEDILDLFNDDND